MRAVFNTREQVEVVRQRRRVAGVLELAQHLGVREHLARVAAAQLEEPPQERRLVHPREQEHVTRDGGLDEGVPDMAQLCLRHD
jgi:hypothetical protein